MNAANALFAALIMALAGIAARADDGPAEVTRPRTFLRTSPG